MVSAGRSSEAITFFGRLSRQSTAERFLSPARTEVGRAHSISHQALPPPWASHRRPRFRPPPVQEPEARGERKPSRRAAAGQADAHRVVGHALAVDGFVVGEVPAEYEVHVHDRDIWGFGQARDRWHGDLQEPGLQLRGEDGAGGDRGFAGDAGQDVQVAVLRGPCEQGDITSTTFKRVPDQPFSSFELTLPEGKYSALAANGNLCKPTTTKTVKKKVTVTVKGHKKTETRKVKQTVAATRRCQPNSSPKTEPNSSRQPK
jgi:hypothetical protein